MILYFSSLGLLYITLIKCLSFIIAIFYLIIGGLSIMINILLFRTKESLFLILRGFTSHHCKISNLERVHFYDV